jgi:hypothetical protein
MIFLHLRNLASLKEDHQLITGILKHVLQVCDGLEVRRLGFLSSTLS